MPTASATWQTHFTAVLDDWDPRVIDGLAAHRHVITFDNRGIGATGGKVPHTIAEWRRTPLRCQGAGEFRHGEPQVIS